MKDILQWVSAIMIAVGGTSVIVLTLSKWFGDLMANKLLEKTKAKYNKELEELKNNYQQELERKKTELEISKSLFLRYSDYRFSLYNDLWRTLCDLKHSGEELWKTAQLEKLKEFSAQLQVTRLTIERSILLIEDSHYQRLLKILDTMAGFEFGKRTVINLRNENFENFKKYGIDDDTISGIIADNNNFLKEFNELSDQLSSSFKQQLRGHGSLNL